MQKLSTTASFSLTPATPRSRTTNTEPARGSSRVLLADRAVPTNREPSGLPGNIYVGPNVTDVTRLAGIVTIRSSSPVFGLTWITCKWQPFRIKSVPNNENSEKFMGSTIFLAKVVIIYAFVMKTRCFPCFVSLWNE